MRTLKKEKDEMKCKRLRVIGLLLVDRFLAGLSLRC